MRANSQVVQAVSKPKAKKGYIDKDYHGFFIEDGALFKFTTYRGVRLVCIQPIVEKNVLTTTCSGLIRN